MAKPNTQAQAQTQTGGDDIENFTFERAKGISISAPDGWFKPDVCKKPNGEAVPLQGRFLRTEPYSSPQFGDGIALVVELTKPTFIAGPDDKPMIKRTGKVLMNVNHLLQDLQTKAEDEERVWEVEVFPTHKSKTKKGHDLQHYEITVVSVMKRSDYEAMNAQQVANMLGNGASPNALPAAAAS